MKRYRPFEKETGEIHFTIFSSENSVQYTFNNKLLLIIIAVIERYINGEVQTPNYKPLKWLLMHIDAVFPYSVLTLSEIIHLMIITRTQEHIIERIEKSAFRSVFGD